MNLNEKVEYWIELATEDIEVAQELLNIGKVLYAGFMCHLAVEKALKAKIESIGKTPLKIHNLIRLAEMGGLLIIMTDEKKELFKTLNPLQIEARYPEHKKKIADALTSEECAGMILQAKDMITWISTQL